MTVFTWPPGAALQDPCHPWPLASLCVDLGPRGGSPVVDEEGVAVGTGVGAPLGRHRPDPSAGPPGSPWPEPLYWARGQAHSARRGVPLGVLVLGFLLWPAPVSVVTVGPGAPWGLGHLCISSVPGEASSAGTVCWASLRSASVLAVRRAAIRPVGLGRGHPGPEQAPPRVRAGHCGVQQRPPYCPGPYPEDDACLELLLANLGTF